MSWVTPCNAAAQAKAHKGGESVFVFYYKVGKWRPVRGASCTPPSENIWGRNTFFISKYFSSDTHHRAQECIAGQVGHQTMTACPFSEDLISPHPDIWLDSGWVRSTFHNNNQTFEEHLVVCLSKQLGGKTAGELFILSVHFCVFVNDMRKN